MRNIIRTLKGILLLLLILSPMHSTQAASKSEINRKVTAALKTLYERAPGAETLASHAKGILVFPDIVKAGLLVGGQYGDGALRKEGKTVGYYR